MHNVQYSLSSAGNCPEEVADLLLDHLCTFGLALALAQAAQATTTIMLTKTISSQRQPPSTGIHPSMDICTPRTTMMDITIDRTKAIPFLPPSLLQRQGKSAPRNRESHQ
jgi:hypothetical protein